MVSLACDTTAAGDATLVTLVLSSPEPTHIRVRNCLAGPVWPPREQGVPEAGWDEDGFSGVVDGTRTLGYACPVDVDEPAEPAAELVDQRPPDDDETPTARSLVRELGDATPPSDAVAPPDDAGRGHDGCEEPTPPSAVTAWLDDVARRLADADRLAAATSVSEAAAAVDAVGGPDEIRTLRDQISTDREVLATVATRCEALAADAESVEIPAETLARLA